VAGGGVGRRGSCAPVFVCDLTFLRLLIKLEVNGYGFGSHCSHVCVLSGCTCFVCVCARVCVCVCVCVCACVGPLTLTRNKDICRLVQSGPFTFYFAL